MFHRILPRLLLASALLSAGGCATGKKPQKKPAAPHQVLGTRFVGKITLVNENERFVLIDGGYSANPASGAVLQTFTGETPSGSLTVSAERRRPFVIADITSGSPKKGDQVLGSFVGQQATPPPPTLPPTAPPVLPVLPSTLPPPAPTIPPPQIPDQGTR